VENLTWTEDLRCRVGELVFQVIREDFLESSYDLSMEGADFFVLKSRPLIELYAGLATTLEPRSIVELGVLHGGSTVFLHALMRPDRIVGIDRQAPTGPGLRDYVAERGLEEVVDLHVDVDQADRARLAEIANDAFGGEAIDLVADDCSHAYEATRASFNELFPRLRPGGVYVIEDWAWAHEATHQEDQVPLTRLVFELTVASARAPELISKLIVQRHAVQVVRGPAGADPDGFEVTDLLDRRGRNLIGEPRTG
jgi:predicted O-methyltransferase YrrM